MKNIINIILAFVAPLTSAPTAWAIFAGITQDGDGAPRKAIPMPDWIAGLGAGSILLVDIAAAILMTDAYSFRKSAKTEEEIALSQPLWWSLLILVVAILSEIFLSLVIVVIGEIKEWGVIVFPFMTLAGAFTVAARIDLTSREQQRKSLQEEAKFKKEEASRKAAETRKQNKLAKERQAEETKRKAQAKAEQEQARLRELQCTICASEGNFYQAKTPKELAGHMGGKHPKSERKPAPKKDDEKFWTCSSCKTINNKSRETCRECGEKR